MPLLPRILGAVTLGLLISSVPTRTTASWESISGSALSGVLIAGTPAPVAASLPIEAGLSRSALSVQLPAVLNTSGSWQAQSWQARTMTASAPPRSPLFSVPLSVQLGVAALEDVLQGGQVRRETVRRRYALSLTPAQLARLRAGGSLTSVHSISVQQALEAVYQQIEARKPRDARFVSLGADDLADQKSWVARGQSGWTVNRAVTAQRLLLALRSGSPEVQVAVRLTPPERTVQSLRAAGVLRHIASGTSSYAGSPSFRVHNIRVGSARLSGWLLGAGEVFDFNRALGRVSAARGFVPGYVILGDRLSLEDGGGVCQVSTTLFRAAYTAGLEMVERHAHSHQVSYYDPPGFEATVYAPSLNFRFRNDTGRALLIQAAWDVKAQTLRFDLFGAIRHDVTVSAPRISGLRPARPPSFISDATLKPGQVVRIDMPASGMQVLIERQIRGEGGKVRRDVTRSSYRPWGGVFAVHPSDPRLLLKN